MQNNRNSFLNIYNGDWNGNTTASGFVNWFDILLLANFLLKNNELFDQLQQGLQTDPVKIHATTVLTTSKKW